jgi:hypothetical protein
MGPSIGAHIGIGLHYYRPKGEEGELENLLRCEHMVAAK